MEFTEEQWRGLAEHCARARTWCSSRRRSRSRPSTCSSASASRSGRSRRARRRNTPLLDRILDTGAPVLLSTGMSDACRARCGGRRACRRGGVPVGVFQCTTAYPCPPEKIGLNLMPVFRERYGCWVGLSDHSARSIPGSRRPRSAWTCSRCTSRCRARCSARTSSRR